MRIASIDSLKLGDVLAKPIISSQGKILLNKGNILNELYMSKLEDMGVKNVYIEDFDYKDIEVSEIISVDTKMALYKALENIFQAMNKNIEFRDNEICEAIRLVCEDLHNTNYKSSDLEVQISSGNKLLEHSINVCILSYIIGNSIGTYNYTKLYDLTLGAILHDIGRVNMESEDKEHTDRAFSVLRKHSDISLNSSIVSYEHHENIDGSGYPRGVKGSNITEFSKITAVADNFDILLNSSTNRQKPQLVIDEMLKLSGTSLDKDIVNTLLQNIVLFPNGINVKLDNGQPAVVIRQNKGLPLKPVVRCTIANQLIDMDLSLDLYKNTNIVSVINYK